MKKIMSLFLSAAMVLGLSGCGSMNNTTKYGLGGAGGGAADVEGAGGDGFGSDFYAHRGEVAHGVVAIGFDDCG